MGWTALPPQSDRSSPCSRWRRVEVRDGNVPAHIAVGYEARSAHPLRCKITERRRIRDVERVEKLQFVIGYVEGRQHLPIVKLRPAVGYEARSAHPLRGKLTERRRIRDVERVEKLQLVIGYVEGRKHLPIVELRPAA